MDILAGIIAYMAGLAAFFGALAVAFFVFFATPKAPLQNEPQSANAMLVRPSTPNKPATAEAHTKQAAKEKAVHSEKHAIAAASPDRAQQTVSGQIHSKSAASTAHARRLIQEDRARRWAYQQDQGQDQGQDHGFDRRFLGYAD
jgi:hypothetical protein